MAIPYPSEPEKQVIIDKIHGMQPTYGQIERVCRLVIQENPNDIYSSQASIVQAISLLVDRSVQKGIAEMIIPEFEKTIYRNSSSLTSTRPLDADLGIQFGNMFTSLLHALEQMNDEELEKYTADIDTADMTGFQDKLENKAKFSKDKQAHAMRSRTEISVLQRIAKKLGYSKYNKLKKKVMFLYFRVCDEFPAVNYKADFRFERLLEFLYDQLPTHIREHFDESLEQLTGVIFDTAYDCYIFNE